MCKEKQYGGSLHFYDDLQILEREDEPLSRKERLQAVEKPLLSWYTFQSPYPALERGSEAL